VEVNGGLHIKSVIKYSFLFEVLPSMTTWVKILPPACTGWFCDAEQLSFNFANLMVVGPTLLHPGAAGGRLSKQRLQWQPGKT
jgi:hypothetical protein